MAMRTFQRFRSNPNRLTALQQSALAKNVALRAKACGIQAVTIHRPVDSDSMLQLVENADLDCVLLMT